MQKLKICAKNIDILLQNYHISSLSYAYYQKFKNVLKLFK